MASLMTRPGFVSALCALPLVFVASTATRANAQEPADSAALADSAKILGEQARHAYRQGTRESLERALQLWAQASDLHRYLGDRRGEGSVLGAIGAVYYMIGRPDSALSYYRSALAIRREMNDRAGEARTLSNMGLAHELLGHPDSALLYYGQALPLSREIEDRPQEGSTLGKIGIVHAHLGHSDSALLYYRQSLAITREVGDRRGEGNTLTNVGVLFSSLANLDSALVYYHQALEVAREVGDRRGEGNTLANIGALHHELGLPDSALVYYRQAVAVSRVVGDRQGEAATLSNIGEAHRVLGRPDSALVYYRKALAISRDMQYRRGEYAYLHNIGTLYSGLGRPDSALLYYGQSLVISRELRDLGGEGLTLNNIGSVQVQLGRADSALFYYRRALPIRRDVGDRRGEGETLGNIGNVHLRLAHSDSALAYLHQSRMIMREIGDRRQEGTALSNIGVAYSRFGEPDSALVWFLKALAIHREVGDRHGEANTVGNVGEVLWALGRVDSASAYYQEALVAHRDAGDREGQSVMLEALGHAHYFGLGIGDAGRAAAYYDSAAALRASVAKHAGSDPNRLSYAEQHVGLYEDWALAWLARSDEVGAGAAARAALAVAERGRAQALLDLMMTSVEATADEVTPMHALTTPGADLTVEGAVLTEGATCSGASALSYLITNDTLLTWLIEPSGEVTVARQVVRRDSVAMLVRALRAGLGVDDASTISQLALRGDVRLEAPAEEGAVPLPRGLRYAEAAAEQLAALLLPPALAARLSESGELVIVPHGPLALVPFGALPLGGAPSEEPFGNRYAIRYAPSLATLGLAEARPGLPTGADRVAVLDRALLVGNPSMPNVGVATGERAVLAPLPRAQSEAGWVAERLGTAALTGAAATESVVRERLAASPVVHLATHGYAYSTEGWARQSFVALAPDTQHDGLFTVGELLDDPALELEAELVVLSACQTGLGDLKQAEGTVGLQRAFLAKGARSVLVSLWSVSDEVTAVLMQRFYTHWLEDADAPSKAEALRRAQEDIRRSGGWEHPRFWAPFQLVGAQ